MKLFKDLDLNIEEVENRFLDCGDYVKKTLYVGENNQIKIYLCYMDAFTNREFIDLNIVSKIMGYYNCEKETFVDPQVLFDYLMIKGITTADMTESDEFEAISKGLLSGNSILFIDGINRAVIVETKGFPNLGLQKAENEVSIQGSNESFSEVFRFNSVLIRRRIKDYKLKLKQMKIGHRSETDIGIMYHDDIVKKDILDETMLRLQNIDIDALLDSGQLEQYIEDDWISPFPQIQVTERPDKAASAILEGRIVVLVENSPSVLIVPSTLNTFLQASDDYYQRFEIVSFVRVLRFICGILAVTLPGLYIATAVFHPSMIPTLLSFKMSSARQLVPFPAIIEILIMEIAFELLREAGIRLPGPVGSAVGIVGGLIIGNAAVDAGIVSPIVVIIIALTGIASFTIPQYALTSGYRLTKYLVTIMSALLGFFGFWVASLLILIHLASLKSFGIPYLFPFVSGDINDYSDWKDTIFRVPLFKMKKRPIFANQNETNRIKPKETGNKKDRE